MNLQRGFQLAVLAIVLVIALRLLMFLSGFVFKLLAVGVMAGVGYYVWQNYFKRLN